MTAFLELVRSSPFVNASLPWRSLTLFAPTNTAIREHLESHGKIDNYTVTYHLANVAKKIAELEEFISTELSGNPPIWITRTARNEIFLNNAKIDQRNDYGFLVKNVRGMDQVLHIIDRVLEPTVPESSDSNLINPDAKKFLEKSSSYNITGPHSITMFASKAKALNKMDMFRTIGRHTFFIPVDEAFKRIQLNTVDSKVIDGHVIPNHVIFLRPSELRRQYETAAFSSSLPVFVEFDRPENSDGRCT
ncbi:Fasciclin-1 [Orchesella cincta]|uniref:Fasciclin-1 n=1 Tax=Orchesella cincta TaxID=48709 RepID=A0A1D2N0J4_ORCCI|nr:Fasciclin-1 [Orchesella cincta]